MSIGKERIYTGSFSRKRLELEQKKVFIIIQLMRKNFTKYEDERPLDTDFTGFFAKRVLIWEL